MKRWVILLFIFTPFCKTQETDGPFFSVNAKENQYKTRAQICSEDSSYVWVEGADDCILESQAPLYCDAGLKWDSKLRICLSQIQLKAQKTCWDKLLPYSPKNGTCTNADDEIRDQCSPAYAWNAESCVLATTPMNYYRYCVDPNPNEEMKQNLQGIQQVLQIANCQQGYLKLLNLKKLYLTKDNTKQNLTSLEFLYGLKNLEELSLKDQKNILNLDLFLLQSWSHLKLLNLSSTGITKLAGLEQIMTLTTLSIFGLKLESIGPILFVPTLTVNSDSSTKISQSACQTQATITNSVFKGLCGK